MGIKEELKDLRVISKIIDSKNRQLAQLKRYCTTIKSFDYSKEKINGGKKQDFSDTVDKIIDLENEINRDIDELIDRKNKMNEFIKSTLSGNEYIVIQMRYFDEYDWIEIAIKLNYTIDNIYKIHGKALFKLNKVYSKLQ
jgi:DNA-directed RNA polymerase sigma-28 factor sigma-D|nr:MAG TPA: RNA polymerase sigma factor [Caudoviricetes sp.]